MSKFLDRIRRSSLRVFTGVDSLVSVNKYGKDNEFYISDEESVLNCIDSCTHRIWHLREHLDDASSGLISDEEDRQSLLETYFTKSSTFGDLGFVYVVISNYSASKIYSGKLYQTVFELVRAGYVVCILENLCYLEPNWSIRNEFNQINWRMLAIRHGVSPDVMRFYQGNLTSTRRAHELLYDNGFDTPIFVHYDARTGKYNGDIYWMNKGKRPDYVVVLNKYHSRCMAFALSEIYTDEAISLELIDVSACAEIVADVLERLDIDHITSIGIAVRPVGRYFLMTSVDTLGSVAWANVNGELDDITFRGSYLN